MSRIKGKDTKPEEIVRKFLFSRGLRYRKHVKTLPGSPDIVLPKYKTVIFVNGCFWHGHNGCRFFVIPKTNTKFWVDKINANTERDLSNVIKLETTGWKVITIWECELKPNNRNDTLNLLISELCL